MATETGKLARDHMAGKHYEKTYIQCPECLKDAQWADQFDFGMLPKEGDK